MYDYLYLNQKMNNKQKLFKLMHKVAGMHCLKIIKNKILVSNNKFQLIINNVLVGETKFNIEEPDEFFNENYVSIYELIIFEKFRNKGYAKILLNKFFCFVKNKLNLNIIVLIVDKNNHKAINLYKKLVLKFLLNMMIHIH